MSNENSKEVKREWVQCFFNATFNLGSEYGEGKFVYGFSVFKLLGDFQPLKEQVKNACNEFDNADMFNFNIKVLTPFHDNVFESR